MRFLSTKKPETMQQATIKTKTAAGAVIARYTMQVLFKKEFQRVKEATGEIIEQWTYRSDKEQDKLAKLHRVCSPLDALAYKYKTIKHRTTECKVFDNSLPFEQSLIFHEVNGEIMLQRNRDEL